MKVSPSFEQIPSVPLPTSTSAPLATGDEWLAEKILDGGDTRLDLLGNGLNKYNVNPIQFRGYFNRGSCTCSPFTPDGYEAAKALQKRLETTSFETIREEQSQRIKALLNYPGEDRFHVFMAPSGSDLCYYSLLFSQLIHPDKPLLNLVTCPEELGSGSAIAMNGRYYFSRNQMGEAIEKGSGLPLELSISRKDFAARNRQGQIIDHCDNLLDLIDEAGKDYSVVANLVIGSKSGIENNLRVVSLAPENLLWTVDLCQFRASKIMINGLLGQNCMVLLTGSKFYQAPPFCGALLVPHTVARRFRKAKLKDVLPFREIFSRHDMPQELPDLREGLKDYQNIGLLLRWEAALKEMEAFDAIDTYKTNSASARWCQFVEKEFSARDCFELMPGQDQTCSSITSFRVKGKDGAFLDHDQLTNLYRAICADTHTGLSGAQKVLFGQPVRYGDRSFIRLALGSYDMRQLIKNDFDFHNDARLIEIIEEYARKLS